MCLFKATDRVGQNLSRFWTKKVQLFSTHDHGRKLRLFGWLAWITVNHYMGLNGGWDPRGRVMGGQGGPKAGGHGKAKESNEADWDQYT